ncbi:CHAP domain-containing protein [Sulfitobacter sp. PS-8MA]|uniref:CHAP domain-containing protein n=1 Tax=Sulfitobacter sp. PS-8MA TaxID=3237707 RepID=UPI0034C602FD
MSVSRAALPYRRLLALCAALLLTTACAKAPDGIDSFDFGGIDPQRHFMAVQTAQDMRAKGQRVWCVPFARNVSGIQIRGNAETWWGKAKGLYPRGKEPVVGAVMAFRATGSIPMGHIAVVSEIVSPREIKVDHANWKRDQVSLRMAVIDVSKANDWSAVRLESRPGAFGSTYPINGFIYPTGG